VAWNVATASSAARNCGALVSMAVNDLILDWRR